MSKSPDAFRTISEVADWLGIQAHVLRFWESKFTQVKPVKRAGGRRYYRPNDMLLLGGIRQLLHEDGLTIKGVQKILREQGIAHVSALSQSLDSSAENTTTEDPVEGEILQFKTVASESDDAPDTAELITEPVPNPTLSDDGPQAETEPATELSDPQLADETGPEIQSEPEPAPTFQRRNLNLGQPSEPVPTPVDEPSQPQVPAEETAPDPTPAPQPKPRIVDAPDPPEESDIGARPGILTKMSKIDRFTAKQAREIAPVLSEMRDWLGRNTSPPTT